MDSSGATQEELDNSQYAVESIGHYEAVFGEDFVSPGGREMAVDLIKRMSLPEGSRVLDVGCGLGGSAFVMASEFGYQVDGIDLSKNMLSMATEKLTAYGLSDSVTLHHGDCLELEKPQNYNAIYSRDVFLHIADKGQLFSVLFALLKPPGQLLFTDYCCGEKPWGAEFAEYVTDRGYHLCTINEYAQLIADAGFHNIESCDLTDRFIDILSSDLKKIETIDLPQTVRDKLIESWRGKLRRASSGDHRWGLFIATRQT